MPNKNPDGLTDDLLNESDPEAEQLWSDEIKRRVAEVRSGRAEMISENEVRGRLAHRLLHGRSQKRTP